ncbi:hypothetical protein CERSUDRAFT_110868 [Gelatoporia subvermispora B]|uniref:Zn(2)-C6 fungal-type domain-containing protein n=1 Tax=Ceriporiopsis subvermispora (strain B) TaxID=914234 RepID=M2RP86_CERS8|nr:hypothetical protein CERSUDRAFT_110868 [Gelatoporia subvermispora B]
MKEGKQRAKPESSRGTYTKQACNHCRRRKSKCDGKIPVCGPCNDTGRASECTWGKETAKKARTQQHFESLVNHIQTLELKVKELETQLEHCHRYHGANGTVSNDGAGPSFVPSSISTSKREEEDPSLRDESDSASDNQDADIDNLIAPTRHLVLRESHLELYGPTSIFRLAPERASPSTDDPGRESQEPPPLSDTHSSYFDWSRHLPPEVPLSRAEHDRLLDLLFKFFTSWGLRIVPELFLRDMHRSLSRSPGQPEPETAHYSPMLHNAIIALATAFSDDPRIRDDTVREIFATKAKSYIESECEKPSISVVNALSTIASFHSSRGEQTLGFMYFGMSGRMSQALGLGFDSSPWVNAGHITHADMIDRNWAYWVTFSQDICWSLYVGRDCCVSPPNEKRPIPVPFVDSEIDRRPWTYGPAKVPAQPSYVATTFAASCELLRIARRIMDFLNALGCQTRRESNLSLVSEIDIQLNEWKDNLAPEADLTAASRQNGIPHKLMLHMSYWWLFILLHRPFYRRSKHHTSNVPEIDHVKLVNRAAENIMILLGIWQEKYSLRYVPVTLIQIIFCAGTSFVLSAVHATSGPRLGRVALSTALSHAEQCIHYLNQCGRSWECGNIVGEILSNVLHAQLKPRLLLRAVDPTSALPMASIDCSRGYQHDERGSQPSSASPASTSTDAHISPNSAAEWYAGTPAPPEWGPPQATLAEPPASAPAGQTLFCGAPYDDLLRDIDMDLNFTNMDLGIVRGQPLSNQPYMGFGLPIPPPPPPQQQQGAPFDVPFEPQQQQVTLDFSQEELAVMDQILRQQFAHPMNFAQS